MGSSKYTGTGQGYTGPQGYAGPLDLDRGVTMKQSWLNPEVGTIGMYKDDPGKYFDANGNEVSEAIARLAGFDTEALARIRFLNQKRSEFEQEMMAEYRKAAGKAQTVLASNGSFSVVQGSNGRADVVDISGQKINPNALTEAEAMRLLSMLQPATEASE